MYVRKIVKAAMGFVLAAVVVGCIPGETVISIPASELECVMTGGVGQVEVEMVLTNNVPMVPMTKLPEKILKGLHLSSTNTTMDAIRVMAKMVEKEVSELQPDGSEFRFSASEVGTNILLKAHIRQKAYIGAGEEKLAKFLYARTCFLLDKDGKLTCLKSPYKKHYEKIFTSMAMTHYIIFGNEDLGTALVFLPTGLLDPLSVKSSVVRITGEGASAFKVERPALKVRRITRR